MVDLCDVIVDIVETGKTLKENRLEVVKEIVPISARFIANKASYKFKADKINEPNLCCAVNNLYSPFTLAGINAL